MATPRYAIRQLQDLSQAVDQAMSTTGCAYAPTPETYKILIYP